MESKNKQNIPKVRKITTGGKEELTVKCSDNDIKRDQQMRIILCLRDLMMQALELKSKLPLGIDLELSNKVSGIFASYINYVKKHKNQNRSTQSSIALRKQQDLMVMTGKEMSYAQLHEAMEGNGKELLKNLDFQFSMPLINMMTGFKLQYDEARLGTTKWSKAVKIEVEDGGDEAMDVDVNNAGEAIASTSGKPSVKRRRGDDGKEIKTETKIVKEKLTDFDLDATAIPLLRGITFKPERRSGLLSTMGPLTLAILMFKENQYKEKIKKAFLNSISHVPNAAAIVETMAKINDRPTYQQYLTGLNRILILTLDRSPHKAMFPFLCFPTDINYYHFDFSGKGMYHFYNTYVAEKTFHVMCGTPSADKAKQAIFHGIFGTYLDDLGILSQITDKKDWHVRSEMSNFYSGEKKVKCDVIGLPKFIRYSKLKSANLTRFGAGEQKQVTSTPVFSGFRKRVVSETALNVAKGMEKGDILPMGNYNLMHAVMNNIKSYISRYNQGEDTIGTTPWYKRIDYHAENGVSFGDLDKDFMVRETGEYFYAPRNE